MTKKESMGNPDDTAKFKKCFIITPIGTAGSETFIKMEGLINSIIEPVLNEFSYTALPAHFITSPGSINKQIIANIVECDIVIANLTNLNPNVMYELAVRHAFGKPVITMAEESTKLPFDIIDQRSIFYIDSYAGVESARAQLRAQIQSIIKDNDNTYLSNPIYDALSRVAEIKNVPQEDQGSLSLILSRLDQLERSRNNNFSEIQNTTPPALQGRFGVSSIEDIPNYNSRILEIDGVLHKKIMPLLQQFLYSRNVRSRALFFNSDHLILNIYIPKDIGEQELSDILSEYQSTGGYPFSSWTLK